MNSEIKILANEIRQIRAQYEAEVGANRRRVWPRAIKDRVMKLCELVGSVKGAAELVGISTDSVYAWRSKSKAEGFKQLTIAKSRSVSVTDTDARPIQGAAVVTVTVTTPDGYLIEGLPAAMVIDVLTACGGRDVF